jgi:hypothetical protein
MGPFNYNPDEVRAWLAARYGSVKHDSPSSATPVASLRSPN